ncbi:MAG TPA: DUF1801 domain-containing protein [Bacteroidia bacterium]
MSKSKADKKDLVKKQAGPGSNTEPQQAKDIAEVTTHIKKLDKSIVKTVEYLRDVFLGTDKNIGERIKWNNPSFYFTGTMKPFDPKEYKREIAVFNLHKNRIMIVFPSGAKLNDRLGFLEGDYKDGRRTAVFKDLTDVKAKEKSLRTFLKKWLALTDK